MIVRDKYSTRVGLIKRKIRDLLIGVSVIAICYFMYPLFLIWLTETQPEIIYFDAEKTWRKSFISNGRFFSKAVSQSSEEAHSGLFSSKVYAEDGLSYGIGGSSTNFKPGKTYKASVWVKKEKANGKAVIVVKDFEDPKFNFSNDTLSEVDKLSGWGRIDLEFKVPVKKSNTSINFYVYTDGYGDVYFDDLKIEEYQKVTTKKKKKKEVAAFDPPKLNLSLSDKAFQKLKKKRDKAIKDGVLITEEDSWVKAILEDDSEEMPVKIRLKGDWIDHLHNEKWSFRVKVKDPFAWNRLINFSLQTPGTRIFVNEWILHKFWEREDILTTRYDFGELSVNGKFLGLYAYEEHFDKQLLEYKSRREGPILRFVEDAMWAVRLKNRKIGAKSNLPVAQLENADILPFKEGRTLANPKLHEDFEIAKTLLRQYQLGEKTAAEIFDIERLAKFHAICDVMGGEHSLIWHNRRFYYNPVIGKLEPIGFDGYAFKPYDFPDLLSSSYISEASVEYGYTLKNITADKDFLQHYFKYIKLYSSEAYMEDFFAEQEEGLKDRVTYLRREYPDYFFDKQKVLNRAKRARAKLLPLSNYSVKAYWKKKDNSKPVLVVNSLHDFPLEAFGTSTVTDRVSYPFKKTTVLPTFYKSHQMEFKTFDAPSDAQYIFYRPFGLDTLFYAKISPWVSALQSVPPQQLMPKQALVTNDFYEVEDNRIFFKKGLHVVKNDIIIPPNYQVQFSAGTQLDFQNGAKFISYSALSMLGTKNEPIKIFSSDKSAGGFTILQASEASKLSYTIFNNFNTLEDHGWQLTGAVTFYESDVNMSHCIFNKNHCEDGLNIIRSKFLLSNVTVDDAPSDGFDADFCEGKIVNSQFINTGNDGIDFSGSQIEIEDCILKNNGDKGISVGENSKVRVKRTSVEKAVIGVASKDLSYLEINSIELKKCNQGFVAYQKKPEFGSSVIQVKSYSAEKVKRLYRIAPGCTLVLKRKIIEGEAD